MIVQDLASAIALGGDCLADIAVVRAQSELFGPVASDPTVSRLVDKLAGDVEVALDALRTARAEARAVAWQHRSPVPADGLVPVDIDGTIVVAHSEKESAAATFKRTFGFHPLLAFLDHGPVGDGGGGEPLAAVLRPGSANANTAADHIEVLDLALAQLPEQVRGRVLVRTDSGGGTKAFLHHITSLGLQYSTGIGVTIGIDQQLLGRLAPKDWTAAHDSNGKPRAGAQVAELTHLLPELTGRGWPAGMRLIARRERPHPGAQLRLTDINGWRVTVFATNSPGEDLAQLEVPLRIVVDNYHTHKHPEVQAWLAKNPRITLHFTPTSGSWLNLVEVFFGIITRRAIRRGTLASVKELVAAIRRFIDGWNERCQPFIWTKTADQILPHAMRQRTSDAGH